MAFTNVCIRAGGSNLNAGTRTGNTTVPGTAADLTYTGGGWVNGTRVFTVASGNPVTDGVAVGDYAALDTGGATAAYIARVSARTATTITLVNTGKGTNPATGTYTLRIGGAWAGPSGTTTFPFDTSLSGSGFLNAAADPVRVNWCSDGVNGISAGISYSTAGPATVQGFTTTYGDGGRGILSAMGSAIVAWTWTGTRFRLADMIIEHGHPSTTNTLVSITGAGSMVERCSFRYNSTTLLNMGAISVRQCEFGYGVQNSSAAGAVNMATAGGSLSNCYIHHADGNASAVGVLSAVAMSITDSIISGCSYGVYNNGAVTQSLTRCVVYDCDRGLWVDNASSGMMVAESIVQGCTTGVYSLSGVQTQQITLSSCALYNNTNNYNTSGSDVEEFNPISLSGSPFTDAANGDFSLNNTAGAGAACRAAGIGTWLQTTSASGSVTNATNATPIVITTSAAHGLSIGDIITVASVGGNTGANGTFTVSAVGSTTTATLLNSAGTGAYTSGGTWIRAGYSSTTTGYPDIGAVQHQDAGGGSVVSQSRIVTNIGTY